MEYNISNIFITVKTNPCIKKVPLYNFLCDMIEDYKERRMECTRANNYMDENFWDGALKTLRIIEDILSEGIEIIKPATPLTTMDHLTKEDVKKGIKVMVHGVEIGELAYMDKARAFCIKWKDDTFSDYYLDVHLIMIENAGYEYWKINND